MADITKEAIQQIASMAAPTEVVSTLPGGLPAVVVPAGFEVKVLPTNAEYAERPLRKKGTVTVFDAESFCEYFGNFSDGHSVIFADKTQNKILAVLDYHEENTGDVGGKPRWGQHRIDLTLRESEEWKVWKAQNGKQVDQKVFAEFIETNAPDIVEPTAATMLEVARSIYATSETVCESAIPTANGSVTIKYNEVVKGVYGPTKEFEIPESFSISIPLYLGGELVGLKARFRYRVTAGKITLWYDLLRWQQAERKAFADIRDEIQEETEVKIFNGAPAA